MGDECFGRGMGRFAWGIWIFSVLLGFGITVCAGQAPNVAPKPDLQVETNRVLVDVEVLDHGNPVHGIPQNRFHVFDDNREQPISSLDEQSERSIEPQAAEALPEHVYTNAPRYPAGTAVNILLFDALNTSVQSQMDVRHQMIEYLKQVRPGTPMMVYALTGELRQLQGFTRDPSAIARVLESAKGNPRPSPILDAPRDALSSGMNQPDSSVLQQVSQFELDNVRFATELRGRITLDALGQLARSLAGISGRKNLIWFSGAFPLSLLPDANLVPILDTMSPMTEYDREVQATSRMLATSRIALFPIDARGLLNLGLYSAENGRMDRMNTPAGEQMTSQTGQSGNTSMQFAMREAAAQTGGLAFLDTNDFGQAVAAALTVGSNYYTLSFAPRSGGHDGKLHHLKITVDGGKYTLSYRPGYLGAPAGADAKIPRTNPILEAVKLGTVEPTQVLFKARILPANDPQIVSGPKLPDGSAGNMSSQLKGPVRRYVVDTLVDARTLACTPDAKGFRQCELEVMVMAFGTDGKPVNYTERGMAVRMQEDQYQKRLETGIPVRSVLDVPATGDTIRVAVRDVSDGKVGALERPLEGK